MSTTPAENDSEESHKKVFPFEELCQQFQDEWKSDQIPSLSEYLDRVSSSNQFGVFGELLRIEFEYRSNLAVPQKELVEYVEEYPQFKPIIRDIWDAVFDNSFDIDRTQSIHDTANDVMNTTRRDDSGSFSHPPCLQVEYKENMPLNVGEYDVEGLIAKGGMGSVYRARHRTLDRLAAIKIMKPEASTERFIREAKLLAKIKSPHVVGIYDYSLSPLGQPVIVMEWVDGVDLKQIIKEQDQPIDEEKVAGWMEQVSRGLSAASKIGVIHRDVKPSNILFDQNGMAMIADFGLARAGEVASDHSLGGGVMGTPLYMAPEQAEDSKNTDTRSDIYSFGGAFYHALTGRPPFEGETAFSILFKHKMEHIVPPKSINPKVSDRLNEIIERCLAKSPRDRFQSFDEITNQLTATKHEESSPWEAGDSKIMRSFVSMYNDRRATYIRHPEKLKKADVYYFPNGRRLEIIAGDITEQHVDAIVSSTNCYLSLRSGLAAKIKKAGGPLVEFDVRRLAINPVPGGRVVVTPGAELMSLYVFHAVIKNDITGVTPSRDILSEVITNSLYQATTLNIESIAFPLIGTNDSAFPIEVCLDTMFRNLVRRLLSDATSLKVAKIILWGQKEDEFEQIEENSSPPHS
ncbi:MAG: protein kinase domain-containing protein [Pirellulales bacterium]